jgi:UDP-glucose 4-epimerase
VSGPARNCLVTGGAGFIGSHLVHRLLRSGHRVSVLDDFSGSDGSLLKDIRRHIRLTKGDIRDRTALRRAFRGQDWVFHLAAMVSVPGCRKAPLQAYSVNAEGTRFALEEAARAGCKKFLYASSCAVYGNLGKRAASEGALPRPLSHYALSKYLGERYALAASGAGGMDCAALRLFNVYGPGQRWDSPYAAVIPRFLRRMSQGKPCIVYGDGRQTRDFVHVADVARAMETAAASNAVSGEALNVASGRSVSILAMHRAMAKAAGLATAPPPRFHAPREDDIRFSRASVSKIRRKMGFRAEISLGEGLRELWRLQAGAPVRGVDRAARKALP